MGVTDFIDNHLKSAFRKFGVLVARRKAWFIVLPAILCCGLSAGLLLLNFSSDPDYLLTPVNGEGRREKALAEKYFPTNFSHYDAQRSVKTGMYGYAMVTSRNPRASILQIEEWLEVREIERKVLEIEVEHKGRKYRYEDICTMWEGSCYTNSLFNVADTFAVINKGFLSEPLHSFAANMEDLSQQLGFNVSMDNLAGITQQIEKNNKLDELLYDAFLKKALREVQLLSEDLLDQFNEHVRPVLDAINLPAYLGGLTWLNRGLQETDICSLVTFPGVNTTTRLCNNPVDFINTVMELGEEASLAEKDVTQVLLDQVRMRLVTALLTSDFSLNKFEEVIKIMSQKFTDAFSRYHFLRELKNANMSQLFQAEAILISGLLDSDAYPEVSRKWELEFLRTIESLDLKYTQVSPLVSFSLELEMSKTTVRMVPILGVNILAMVIFSMAVCCTRNIIQSKPWVGLAGVLSTLLATISGFGLLILCGAEFTSFNFGAVFIMVGIGLDDTFVVLNSWQRTDRKASVPERLGETMAESGVSILITSLTDAVSFFTAIMAPYPYVKIFCLYSGVCIVFLFLFQITFFTACLAWSGEHEAEERSGITFRKLNDEDARFKGCLYFELGEYQVDVPQSEERKMKMDLAQQAAGVSRFILRSRSVRIIILALFIAYMSVAIYGLLNVRVYFDKTKLINYDSSMTKFVHLEDKLFRKDAYSISIILTGDFNYTNEATLNRIEKLLSDLESLEHINPHMTKSWLQHYHTMSAAKNFLLNRTDVEIGQRVGQGMEEGEFVGKLYKFYRERNTPFSMDVSFNEDKTRIVASRFIIQGQDIHTTLEEQKMAISVREVCRTHSDSVMQVTAYNSYFIYTDQYISVFSQTLQCVLTTGLSVIVISLVLLPDLLTAVSTVLSVISTLIGTIGLMSMWDIEIDGITLINLVMCIGFSVDFSAHFSYHYIDRKKKTGDSDVIDQSLVAVVKPILQAATSTILGMVGLVKAPSAGFIIFFKMIFIVICLGVIHALVLLPCLLQFMVDVRARFKRKFEPVVLLTVRQMSEEVVTKSKPDVVKS